MIALDETELRNLLKTIPKGTVKELPKAAPAPQSELTDILKAMVSILNRPVEARSSQIIPAPIVTVSPPMVSVNPSITVEPSARRWRFTVTKRDNTAQQRIQEIVIETLE